MEMTEPLRNAAGESLDPARDRPGLAIRALAGATFAGAALVGLVLWTVRTILLDAAPSDQPVIEGPAFFVLIMGTMTAVAVAAVLAWLRLRPLTSSWRRSVFAMLAGFGTVIAAMAATPVDHHFGRQGLAAMSIACGLLALLLLGFRSPSR